MNLSYWKNKTVIVSGGFGFIGSHFVEELAEAGANVICLYRSLGAKEFPIFMKKSNIRCIKVDLLDQKELVSVCRYVSPKVDCFIHCAALDGNTEFKLKYAAQILDTNNQLVSNVLNSCSSEGIEDVVILSSAEIYSPKIEGDISESDDYHRHFTYSHNGYLLSKVFGEILAELHNKQYGTKVYIPRPTNVYGPRDSFKAGTNRVIPSMIQKIAKNETVEIWGDGKQTRSFIFIKDLIFTTLAMVEKNKLGAMNIATKDQVSILDLAKYISKEFKSANNIKLDKSKPIGVRTRSLDVGEMYNIIDFAPSSIHEGLSQTINWYRSVNEP